MKNSRPGHVPCFLGARAQIQDLEAEKLVWSPAAGLSHPHAPLSGEDSGGHRRRQPRFGRALALPKADIRAGNVTVVSELSTGSVSTLQNQLRKSLAQAQEQLRAGLAKLASTSDELDRCNESPEVARMRAADLPTLEQERAEMQRFQEIIRGYQELVAEQASLSLAPLQTQLQQLEQKLAKQREEQEQTQAKLQLCEQSLQQLGEISQAAHWQSALRQELTAQVLRQQLQADCPCPVCLQTVAQLPPASAAEQSQLHGLSPATSNKPKSTMKTCAPRRPCCWLSSHCWKASWRKPEGSR